MLLFPEDGSICFLYGFPLHFLRCQIAKRSKERVVLLVAYGSCRPVPWKYLYFMRELQQPFATLDDLAIGTTLKVSAADAPGEQRVAGKQELTLFMVEADASLRVSWCVHDQKMAVMEELVVCKKPRRLTHSFQCLFIPLEETLVKASFGESLIGF